MENLGIDIKIMIAQLINFLLFFFIVKKFIAKPFSNFLNEEKNKEKEKARLLEEAKKIEENLIIKEKKAKEQANKEMRSIIDETKKSAVILKEELVNEAHKAALEIKEKAKAQIEEEREKLYKDLKDKVAELSLDLVNKGLKDSLDKEMQKKVTEKILKNLN